ncbi:hypothetical protein [Arenimonas alkanexedens]
MAKNRPALVPQIPGAAPITPSPEPLPTVPESFLAEIAVLSDEGLISLDTAERSGEHRPEYLAAIEAELQPRIARQGGLAVKAEYGTSVVAEALADVSAIAPIPSRPGAAAIDPSTLIRPVLTADGWLMPSTATPPIIR